MAEGVLFNIAAKVLIKLSSPALQEIRLLWRLGDELEKLQSTVSTIKAVLLDAEKLYQTNNEVRLWLDDLKDGVYDADDLLDEISTRASSWKLKSGNVVIKEVRLFFSGSNRLAYGFKMAHKVKAIRAKLDGIAENRRFHLIPNLVEPTIVSLNRDTHSSAPNIVIGREDDKKTLMTSLMASRRENVAVIPIVGLGGLGKTTLAQIIYDDETVKKYFDLRVWVCVSDIFHAKAIVEKMIECIDGGRLTGNQGMEALKIQLKERVNGKKYLLVLDDVWNEEREVWTRLSDLISSGAPGSRIIVTTRNRVVAQTTNAMLIYELKGLSLVDSWDLFQKVAFEQGQPPSNVFDKLGKEIVSKCGGLPLAIRTIGDLLYTKTDVSEWQYFKDEEFSRLDQEANVVETLKLSYNHLPSNLKHCFAYCSLFPKNYIFDVSTLIRYWKSQGYVDSRNGGTSIEEKGLNCLKYLVQRSFFQIEQENEDGEIVKCRMHDFMHDLATSVAGEEVILLVNKSASRTTITEKTRHISLHEVSYEVKREHLVAQLHGKKARTLIIHPGTSNGIAEEELLIILDKLRYLRVLALSRSKFKILPSFIGKLEHLRQFDLSGNQVIEMLPDSITQLYNLQELNLEGCSALKKLPWEMKKLINLIHLEVGRCYNLEQMPPGIGQLISLEVLPQFVLSRKSWRYAAGGLDELRELNKVRGALEIRNLQYANNDALECEAAKLKDKPHLRSLTLQWKINLSMEDTSSEEKSLEALQPHVNLRVLGVEGYNGRWFPSWTSSLDNLVQIELTNCGNCEYLPSLAGLGSLQHLRIERLGGLEYMIGNYRNCENLPFFPSLKTLTIKHCDLLKGWLGPQNCKMPCLLKLEIKDCRNFKRWEPKLPSLDSLELEGISVELLEDILKQAKPSSTGTGASTSTSNCLSPLRSLSIEEIKDLDRVRLEALNTVAFLKSLEIGRLKDTSVLSEWLYHLTSLDTLSIRNCEDQLNLFEEENEFLIRGLPDLRCLGIWGCRNMESLPTWIQHLTSLQTLEIGFCEELEDLPEWVRSLSLLNRLEIYGCPKLNARWEIIREKDWRLIAHIPNIRVDDAMIQAPMSEASSLLSSGGYQ